MKATLQREPSKTNEALPTNEFIAPEVNIFETKEGYVLEAEMPGVSKDGLEITLEGTEITIIGRRNHEPVSGDALVRERRSAHFRRIFELDPVIDTTKINARMNQGVLVLNLPKSERVQPRKVTVSD